MGKVKKSVEADASASSSKYDPEANSKAIMIRHIPYGFFEKELKSYFSQFGNIRRVRLPRNRKTGNYKGWAFVLFTDHEVAQLAAEAMDGYLMYEKRLVCKVLKNKDFPKCLTKGPRIVRPPEKYRTTKKHAVRMNKKQSGWDEESTKSKLLKNVKKKRTLCADWGYQLPPVLGLADEQQSVSTANGTGLRKDEEEMMDESSGKSDGMDMAQEVQRSNKKKTNNKRRKMKTA